MCFLISILQRELLAQEYLRILRSNALLLCRLRMATLRQHAKELLRRFIRINGKNGRAIDTLAVDVGETSGEQETLRHRSYSAIPGPKPVPLLGNTWRFLPYLGTKNR